MTLWDIADKLWETGHRKEYVALRKLILILPAWIIRLWEKQLDH